METQNNTVDIVKSDFDLMIQYKDLEVVTAEQMDKRLPSFEKADGEKLTEEEEDIFKSSIEDLMSYQKYNVLEDKDGVIKSTTVFVREKQMEIDGSVEKGEFGEIIKAEGLGTFLETEMNTRMDRVGESFQL